MNYLIDFFKNIGEISFAQPLYFLLLLLFIPILGWQIWKRHKIKPGITLSTVKSFAGGKKTWKQRFFWLPLFFRYLALVLIIVALARPQTAFKRNKIDVEGVDIVITLDISGSMKMMDFSPNRLEAAKKVAGDFIEGRPNDRIGLVVYAGEAFTQCPLTSDHQTLLGLLEKVKFELIEDGTAIGDGLGTALNRLRESEAKSKIVILLTDGVNNTGYLDPYSAAEIAHNLGIKVYTVGCGTNNGQAPYPTPYGPIYMPTELDEPLLSSIAQETGGKYFRATNNKKLKEVYAEIDKMEKTKISESVFENKSDEFVPFLILAIGCLLLEIIFRYFIFRGVS